MPEPGQKFTQMLLDGKIHECEYVEPLIIDVNGTIVKTDRWIAKIIDCVGTYKHGQHFYCDPTKF